MLEKIEFVNFRNLKNTSLIFSPHINIFYGDNAQGKTNLLEAIYLLSSGKSFRAQTDQELIAWEEQEAKITGSVPPLQLELLIKTKSKRLLVNRQPKRLVDLVGEFVVVLFAPEDLQLVTGAPLLRRAWLNALLSKLDKNYLLNLVKFNQVLKNRNRVLLQLKQGLRGDLSVWDEQLLELSWLIWQERKSKVVEINEHLKKLSKKLAINRIYLDYKPQVSFEGSKSKEQLALKLALLKNEEIARAQSLLGPHRDDFVVIFEEVVGPTKLLSKDVGVYGSRGEQRTAVLSLKLVELEVIQALKKKRPSLLLDDVLSEFDRKHREMIQNLLYQQQSFITTTSKDFFDNDLLKKAKTFFVKEGSFSSD